MDGYHVVTQIEVRWGDMDAFAHVNNVQYFAYFEQARIAYFQASGILDQGAAPKGIGPILASTECRFRAPVAYPDTLIVGARVRQLEQDRFTMEYQVVSHALGRVAATGKAVVVSYDYAAGQKCSIPQTWLDTIRELDGQIFDE